MRKIPSASAVALYIVPVVRFLTSIAAAGSETGSADPAAVRTRWTTRPITAAVGCRRWPGICRREPACPCDRLPARTTNTQRMLRGFATRLISQATDGKLRLSHCLAQRSGFVVVELKNGVQAGHLECLAHNLVRTDHLQLSALVADDRVAADHAADGGGIDDGNLGKIDDNIVG